MKPETIGAGVVAWVGASLASLCCLLPLTVIALGLGSGAFMAVTMQYRWIFIPAGIAGVLAGVVCTCGSGDDVTRWPAEWPAAGSRSRRSSSQASS